MLWHAFGLELNFRLLSLPWPRMLPRDRAMDRLQRWHQCMLTCHDCWMDEYCWQSWLFSCRLDLHYWQTHVVMWWFRPSTPGDGNHDPSPYMTLGWLVMTVEICCCIHNKIIFQTVCPHFIDCLNSLSSSSLSIESSCSDPQYLCPQWWYMSSFLWFLCHSWCLLCHFNLDCSS